MWTRSPCARKWADSPTERRRMDACDAIETWYLRTERREKRPTSSRAATRIPPKTVEIMSYTSE